MSPKDKPFRITDKIPIAPLLMVFFKQQMVLYELSTQGSFSQTTQGQ